MKIYLAHNYAAKEWLNRIVVPQLCQLGHTITSRWLLQDEEDKSISGFRQYAETDLMDVFTSDLVIHFADQVGETPGRGKYFEIGAAHCMNKKIYIVGLNKEQSVFYFLIGMERFDRIEDVLEKLTRAEVATMEERTPGR